MFTMLSNFFITQLIWNITIGSYHLPINIVVLGMLLKLWDHLTAVKALALSLFLTICAFVIFIALVAGIFAWGLNVPYVLPADTYQGYYDYLSTSLISAAFYTVLQSGIAVIIHQWDHLNLWRVFMCIVCSNLLTSLLVYKLALIKYAS